MEDKDFLNKAEDINECIVKFRRDIHSYPELGFKEFKTSQYIKDFLRSEGIEYYETAGTGICGIIRGKGSRVVALRADMDALPINEKNDVQYKSHNLNVMHACGHDAHCAMLMGAAKILNSIKDGLPGSVKLFFEPAEETTGGANVMISEGVLEDPYVSSVIGLHVSEDIPCGKTGIKHGVFNAASNPFMVTIQGRGGHGAHPDACIDPIVVSANIINMIQTVVSREISPTSPAVITIGSINGGNTENIIPDEVILKGIIRTMTKEEREIVIKRFSDIIEGTCKAMRAKSSIIIREGYPCLHNDEDITNIVEKHAINVLGKDNVIKLTQPSMGVESFAYFAGKRPSTFYYLGCRNDEKGINKAAHSSLFNIDENCLKIGAALQSLSAYNTLKEKFKE